MRSCLTPTHAKNQPHPNYYGPMDFLENPTAFSAVFGSGRPTIVELETTTSPVTQILTVPFSDSLPRLTRLCYFTCLSSLLENDYVGAVISNDSATQAIFHTLRSFTANRFDPATRKKTHHSPSDILQSFLSLVTTLDSSSPSSIASWPSSLAQQFLCNLPLDLQSRLQKGRSSYRLKDHASLSSFSSQLNELRQLCQAAQEIYDEHAELRNICRTQTSSYLSTLYIPTN